MLTTEELETTIRLKKYPYQNDQRKDMKGEIWKFIPDCDDAYMMSNFGRIRSLARIVYRKNGTHLSIREKIKTPRFHRVPGISKYHPERTAYCVESTINVNAKNYRIIISRYLYYLFIEKFDMSDFDIKVTFKDGNHLNLSLNNLTLSSVSDVIKRTYTNGKIRIKYGCKAKKVAQYTVSGEFIAEYPSMTAAAHATGLDEAAVYRTATGKFKHTKGFIFKEIE